ncbi:Mur ligase domain-containing protein [Acinetobacter baumannii]|uniref:Mur ligase domain-containing protein n=1 Tax=Acinetobacter baumannii TaxID=470 RepID=UPI0021B00947|nr:Mur ligase domain-containing protein [Acinetobacter baumannii]MCT2436470.1 Mur ligase domain-containing protein [Acinetobacter baumannii]
MHLHILGICGTFMGSLALLARDLGHKVTGSDSNVYPPMSTQLENAGIELMQAMTVAIYSLIRTWLLWNAMKRGIDAVEYMLNEGLHIFLVHSSLLITFYKVNMCLVWRVLTGKQLRQPCCLGT